MNLHSVNLNLSDQGSRTWLNFSNQKLAEVIANGFVSHDIASFPPSSFANGKNWTVGTSGDEAISTMQLFLRGP